jgi:hypothetical protein
MPNRFPTFEVVLKKRGRKWRWCVCTTEGTAIMQGSERNRSAAKYQADRALFLLLITAPYRLQRASGLDVKDVARVIARVPRLHPVVDLAEALESHRARAKTRTSPRRKR